MKRTICAILFLLSFALNSALAEDIYIVRPNADKGPTEVKVSLAILDVDEISSSNQTVTANVFVSAAWNDPSLRHKGPGKLVKALTDVWHPQLQFLNQQRMQYTYSPKVHVSQNGNVLFRQRAWGAFSEPLKLKDFPFDRHQFALRVVSGEYNADEIVFVQDERFVSGLPKGYSVADWRVESSKVVIEPQEIIEGDVLVPMISIRFEAHRQSNYWILKVIVPLVLIVLMSWTVFWLDPESASTQIGVATTSMLTLIAYRFMVGTVLPKVPYLTRLDVFILLSTILVFSALAESVFTAHLAVNGNAELARKIDRIGRWVYLLALVLVTLYSFVFRVFGPA